MILESVLAKVTLAQMVALDHGAHRTVQDVNSVAEQGSEFVFHGIPGPNIAGILEKIPDQEYITISGYTDIVRVFGSPMQVGLPRPTGSKGDHDMTDHLLRHSTFPTRCGFLEVAEPGKCPTSNTQCRISKLGKSTDETTITQRNNVTTSNQNSTRHLLFMTVPCTAQAGSRSYGLAPDGSARYV